MPTSAPPITAQVSCIRKTDHQSPYDRIAAIGGLNSDGTRWRLSTADAIAGIEIGKYRFYVERPEGDRVWVVVAVAASRRKYLKTQADGDVPNNLLSLPECP